VRSSKHADAIPQCQTGAVSWQGIVVTEIAIKACGQTAGMLSRHFRRSNHPILFARRCRPLPRASTKGLSNLETAALCVAASNLTDEQEQD
jgi:hypothetical protein